MASHRPALRFGLILAATTLVLGAGSLAQPPWQLPTGVKTLAVNGYPMAYLERGTGPTAVLVHGAVNDYRTWEPQMSSLSPHLRVVAVSLRHYFPERWNGKDGKFSEKQHGDDLVAFIEQLGGPVHLVGHSRGAMPAILAARSRPDLVRRLVLMEPPLTALLPAATGAEDPRVTRWKVAVARFQAGDMDGGLESFADGNSGPGTWKRLPEDRRQIARDNAWTIAGQLADPTLIMCADLEKLKPPVLLIGGEKTTAQFLEVLDAAQKCLPSAQRQMIPNAGHVMHRQNPADFDAVLVKFLLN